MMRSWQLAVLVPILAGGFAVYSGARAQQDAGTGKAHGAVEDNNAARINNGFKRYHGGCNHCHVLRAWVQPSALPSLTGCLTSKHSGVLCATAAAKELRS